MASANATATRMMIGKRLFDSTIGLKVVMAVTGAYWVFFVLQHMVANLQLFLPIPDSGLHPINAYAHFMQGLGGLLWVLRGSLILSFALHIWSAIKLKSRNDAARPVAYDTKQSIQARKPSYMMTLSGLVILAFVAYHLAHFTLGFVDPEGYSQFVTVDGTRYHDVYMMMIAGFKQPLVAGLYIVANVLLGLHLHHAASSLFQTLGLRSGGYQATVDKIGPAIAVIVIGGNVAMPLSVQLGIVG